VKKRRVTCCCLYLKGGHLEDVALLADFLDSRSNIDTFTLAKTRDHTIELTEVVMAKTTGADVCISKGFDTRLTSLSIVTWRSIAIASSLLVAALSRAEVCRVLVEAILIAWARTVAGAASIKSKTTHSRLGSSRNTIDHGINGLPDRNLPLKLLTVGL